MTKTYAELLREARAAAGRASRPRGRWAMSVDLSTTYLGLTLRSPLVVGAAIITINGANDAPVANPDTNWTIEDAAAAITGDSELIAVLDSRKR